MGETSVGVVPVQRPNSVAPPVGFQPPRPTTPGNSRSTRWVSDAPSASGYGMCGGARFAAPLTSQPIVSASSLPAATAAAPMCKYPKPYEGDEVFACPTNLDFSKAEAVTVSGASWNLCGHMLLCVENGDGHKVYFHVTELYGPPKMMSEDGYRCYLADQGKHEIRREDGKIHDPAAAYRKLMELVSQRWLWTPGPHNCVSFAQQVIEAGGGHYSNPLNCPDIPGLVHALAMKNVEKNVADGLKK